MLLFAAWIGLVTDFAGSRPAVWFSFAAVSVAVCAVLHFIPQRKDYSVSFLFSLVLICSGALQVFNLPWLKPAYFLFIIVCSAFYGTNTMLGLSLLMPLLGLKAFIKGNTLEEAAFWSLVIAAAALSGFFFDRLRREKEKAVASYSTLRDNARNIALDTGMESLSSDEIMSHYFASVLKTDEEIMEMLLTVRHAVLADSVNLFTLRDNAYSLRCSTAEKDGIIITGKGIISSCIRDKKVYSSGELTEKDTDLGYIRPGKVSSIIAAPLMDGPTVTGVLSADSARYQAFNETEKNTVKMFANHLVRIMERERIYLMIKRDIFGLKVLREESSNLVSSLNTEVVVRKLCEGAGKISAAQIFFFMAKGKQFELMPYAGDAGREGKLFDLRGTFINMVVENRQPIYMSDVTGYRGPVMPFKVDDARSVYAVPMLYESSLLGLFVMLGRKNDELDPFQTDMLKVLCNQAATSLANAKLHAEIEKLATTDGLTGLFNHRVFQERLSEELRRQNRFAKPVSLLLTDIDFFKKINDTYGHPVGDIVLKGVSKIIGESIREIDIASRYGGEEFAVILPGTEGEGATNIAERLRKAVMDKEFSADGKSFHVTISIGIAIYPSDAKSKEELIERADQALYNAKHGGRNRTVLRSAIG